MLKGSKHNIAVIRKMSAIHKRIGTQPPSWSGKKHSNETIIKMRLSAQKTYDNGRRAWHKDKIGYRKLSEISKQKIREKRANQILNNNGKNNPMWRGGVTPETTKRCNEKQWQVIRKNVYARDNWTCQICGNDKVKLNAHHIIPYRISKSNEMENLIALCNKCHAKQEHAYYNSLGFNNDTNRKK